MAFLMSNLGGTRHTHTDHEVLQLLAEAIRDPAVTESWRSPDPGAWQHVELTEDGHIRVVDLKQCNLGLNVADLDEPLSCLPHLTELDLRFNQRLLGDLRNLTRIMPRLKKLGVTDTGITGSLADVAAHGKQLTVLWFANSRIAGNLGDLAAIAGGLRELSLNGTDVTGNVASISAEMPNLIRLGLRNTQIDGALTDLFDMAPRLEIVYLSNTHVYASDLVEVAKRAPHLRELRTRGTIVRKATIEDRDAFLRECPTCQVLDIDMVPRNRPGFPLNKPPRPQTHEEHLLTLDYQRRNKCMFNCFGC